MTEQSAYSAIHGTRRGGGDLAGGAGSERAASWIGRTREALRHSTPFSSLQRRIIFFNLAGLVILVTGITFLPNSKTNMVEVYVDALERQGQIIAIAIAETAGRDLRGQPTLDPLRAETVLNRLALPTRVRIRLYDDQLRLTSDTYNLAPSGPPIEVLPLAPPSERRVYRLFDRFERAFERFIRLFREKPPIYYEVPTAGISRDREVHLARRGATAHELRINSQEELIVSVAMPVTRFKAVLGVLQLSTEGGVIEDFVIEERRTLLEVFLLATLVSIMLSVVLANMIAAPIRRLSRAAENTRSHAALPVLDRSELPDLTNRTDEIGDLSGALIRMTNALYGRIEANESFAADVAHEIKNPLTSLRSAVETMAYARTPEQAQKLRAVIMNDVDRLDRLVTDISNASRLDAEMVREEKEQFDMGTLITALAEVTATQGAPRDVSVETQLPAQPLLATGLEGRLAQVITNLLDNALSFSPDGGRIRIAAGAPEPRMLLISILDQGPGIPPASLDSIFDRFYSERPQSETFGNHSGLGLSICRQIVEAHNGRIWADNAVKPETSEITGALFVLELPTG